MSPILSRLKNNNKKKVSKKGTRKKNKKKKHNSIKKSKIIVIKNSNIELSRTITKSLKKLKSFSPSVNKKLKSLHTYTPEYELFSCKERQISIPIKNRDRKCVYWTSKEAQDIMLKNLTTTVKYGGSTKKFCNNIIAPKQVQSNCWFNTFFVVFFISDKGRKFFRYLRETMITGNLPSGKKIPKQIRWPFFLLNKCIEASLIGTHSEHDYAYLMDTNDIIRAIHKKIKSRSIAATKEAFNPLEYYKGIINYLGETDITIQVFDKATNTDINRQLQEDKTPPEMFIVERTEGEGGKKDYRTKTNFTISNSGEKSKVKYQLDSAVLRSTDGAHFSAYITCGGKEFGFDGESYSRLQPFKWKNKLNKNTKWKFVEQYDTYFNFTNGYQILFYYRIK